MLEDMKDCLSFVFASPDTPAESKVHFETCFARTGFGVDEQLQRSLNRLILHLQEEGQHNLFLFGGE